MDLERFLRAQDVNYDKVIEELRVGKKQTHWMWYIFPQVQSLGYSKASRLYSIKSVEEAKAYLKHDILGKRLIECVKILLEIQGKSAQDIFGNLDSLKLRSSMTLFYRVSNNGVFKEVLDKYFNGKEDKRTLRIMKLD